MENRNWDEFRYLSKAGESKYYDKKYYPADCLQPGLYVNIFTTYTDTDALLQTYRRIVDLVGDKMRDQRHVGSYSLILLNQRFAVSGNMCLGHGHTGRDHLTGSTVK